MWENNHQANIDDHVLTFIDLTLVNAKYKKDWGYLIDVEFGDNYYIDGVNEEPVEIIKKYRGLKGTRSYQVDLIIGDRLYKTFYITATPFGDTYQEKTSIGW